jgi:hypothetical protein
MSTIMFKVRQGETEFVSGAQVASSGHQPEVELVTRTRDEVDARRKVDVDIYMYNTGKLGAVRVFMCGDEARTPARNVLPSPSPAMESLKQLAGLRAISYCPAK